MYILDTYVWIEYFFGRLERHKRIVEGRKTITLECTLGELSSYCEKNSLPFDKACSIIRKKSTIAPVLEKNWIAAGKIKAEMRRKRQGFGLIDALLVAKQRELKCFLVSGGLQFRGLKNIVLIQ